MRKSILLLIFASIGLFAMETKIMLVDEVRTNAGGYDFKNEVTSYRPDAKSFHALISFKKASKGDKVTVKWVSIDAINVPNYTIYKSEYTLGDTEKGVFHAALDIPAKSWPTGHYSITLYNQGKKINEKMFAVTNSRPNSATVTPKKQTTTSPIKQITFAKKAWMDKEGYIQIRGAADTFDTALSSLNAVVEYQGLNAPGDVEVQWYVVKAGDTQNYLMLKTPVHITLGSGAFYATITMDDKSWPQGEFRVDILYDGHTIGSKHFTITQTHTNTNPIQKNASPGIQIDSVLFAKKAWHGDHGIIQTSAVTDLFSEHATTIYAIITYHGLKSAGDAEVFWNILKEDGSSTRLPFNSHFNLTKKHGVMMASMQTVHDTFPVGKYSAEIFFDKKKVADKAFNVLSEQAYASAISNNIDNLTGSTWVDKSEEKPLTISFPSVSQFNYNGYIMPCTIDPQKITAQNKTKKLVFEYGISGDTLYLTMNGNMGVFQRVIASKQPTTNQKNPSADSIDILTKSIWINRDKNPPSKIFFPSKTTFSYDGQVFPCTVDKEKIRIKGNKGWITLLYRVEGNRLFLTLNHDTTIIYLQEQKVASAEKPRTPANPLKGKYCSSSDTSNEWIEFDGKGGFSFGSLANSIVAATGRYTLDGKWIKIHVKGENLGKIHVTQKHHADITAFEFDHITYTKALCPGS